MKNLGYFLVLILAIFGAGKGISHLVRPLFVHEVPAIQLQRTVLPPPTLQELIHGEVIEAQKGVPRKKLESGAASVWLTAIEERQGQIVYTYEFVGVPPEAFGSEAPQEMRQEAVQVFRSRCSIPAVLNLLNRGMTVAHIYRIRETGGILTTMVFSRHDC